MLGLKNRLRLLSLIVFLFAIMLAAKLYLVQIVSGEEYTAKAEHQYVTGENYFDRGSIFFTTKEGILVPAASIKLGFILNINPEILRQNNNIDNVYEIINEITARYLFCNFEVFI